MIISFPATSRSFRRTCGVIFAIALGLVGPAASRAQSTSESWSEGFRRLTDQLASRYAFTKWKAIHWEQKYAQWAPEIQRAEQQQDEAAYYLALRSFVHSLPDRHIKVRGEPAHLRFGMVGGSYGFTLAQEDTGSVIVTRVLAGSSAEDSGIRPGTHLVSIGGIPVQEALDHLAPIWARGLGGTREALALEQLRWLPRAPVGTRSRMKFVNPSLNHDAVPRTMTLVATGDAGWSAEAADFYTRDAEREQPVTSRLLEDRVGYLKVTTLAHPDAAIARMIDDDFRGALQAFLAAEVHHLILDLRHNSGGLDELGAKLVGHFYQAPAPYLRVAYFDAEQGSHVASDDPEDTVVIEPQLPFFDKPITVLVSPGTVSAGEGMAEAVQRIPNGEVAGFFGSNGSYGITGGRVDLPGGYRVTFPIGLSLDGAHRVLIDTDEAGVGGVIPDVRVPRTANAILAEINGEDPELEFVLGRILDRQ